MTLFVHLGCTSMTMGNVWIMRPAIVVMRQIATRVVIIMMVNVLHAMLKMQHVPVRIILHA